jgi:4-amino-4-deoxy-L-arabinose transferase-like glycosyltransferase/DNA-binding beta-propeller fold protein YncE
VEWIILAAIFVVGAFFRLYGLPDIPMGMSIDGSANALKALDILRGAPYEPLYLSRETMYHYFMAVFLKLFGFNLVAVRLTSVFFGLLALVTFYLLAREWFDSRLALIALLIFATSVYHITYSRSEWRVVQVPAFEFAALYFLRRAMRQGHLRWWALTGVMVGLGLNTYESFRFVVVTVGLLVLSQFPRPGFLRRHWRGVILLAIFSAIFFGPLGVYSVTHWQEFNARASAVFIGERIEKAKSLQPLWDNVRNTALTYIYRAVGDFFDNAKPLLSPLEGLLYLGGLGVLLANVHRRRAWMLLLWFVLGLMPGIFSWPNAQRLMAATPLAFLMGGIFVYAVWVLLDEAQVEIAAYPMLAAVGIVCVVWSYQVYLGPHRRIVWGYEPERMAVALYLKPIGATDETLVEERFNQGQVDFINYVPGSNPFVHRFETFDLRRDVPLRRPVSRPVTLVLEERPENRALVPILQEFYPDLRVEEVRDAYGRLVAFGVRIPRETVEAAWGLRAAYFADGRWQRPLAEGGGQTPSAGWPADARSAEWRGFLWVDELNEYHFRTVPHAAGDATADENARPEVTGTSESAGHFRAVFRTDTLAAADCSTWLEMDGRPVIEEAQEGSAFLTRGLHSLRLRMAVTGQSSGCQPSGDYRLAWRAGDGIYQPVPREHLFVVDSPDRSLVGTPARREEWAWQQVWSVGGHGRAPGQFARTMNVAVDLAGSGFVYVGDADNRRVQKLRKADGSFVAEWGRLGTGPGELEHELGLALGPGDTLYVSDRWNERVQRWSVDGEFRDVWLPPGQVATPHAIAVLPDGDLLVASAGHLQVRRFGADGVLKAAWGQAGTGPGEFVEPVGLAYDPRGAFVYVTDAGKRTVQKYTLDGQFLAEWPAPGVTWESYVAVDPEGRVHVTAPEENSVYIFDGEGTMLVWGNQATRFSPFSIPLNHPMGLAFDETGDLYLTNTWADQVMRFHRVPADQLVVSPAVRRPTVSTRPPVPFPPRFVYQGNTESRVWEAAVGNVTVTGGRLVVRVAAMPGFNAVYDYLRFVGRDEQEYRFEAEDTALTRGDTFNPQPGLDDHWWLQDYGPFSGGRGLVAEDPEAVPMLETTVPLPDGEYQMFLGTFTGDPANGPFAIALDY